MKGQKKKESEEEAVWREKREKRRKMKMKGQHIIKRGASLSPFPIT